MKFSSMLALAAAFAVLAIGCSEEANSPFQPNVVNEPDTFAVQASGLSNTSVTETYQWQNPGLSADVGQSGVLASGTAIVTVTDADGATVYTGDLSDTGTFTTNNGVAGLWTVQLVLTNCTGDIDFSLQTP